MYLLIFHLFSFSSCDSIDSLLYIFSIVHKIWKTIREWRWKNNFPFIEKLYFENLILLWDNYNCSFSQLTKQTQISLSVLFWCLYFFEAIFFFFIFVVYFWVFQFPSLDPLIAQWLLQESGLLSPFLSFSLPRFVEIFFRVWQSFLFISLPFPVLYHFWPGMYQEKFILKRETLRFHQRPNSVLFAIQ